MRNARPAHPAIETAIKEFRSGQLTRRDFLVRATALGMGAATAIGIAGRVTQAEAQALEPKSGGTLRISMAVMPCAIPAFSTGRKRAISSGLYWNHSFASRGILLSSLICSKVGS